MITDIRGHVLVLQHPSFSALVTYAVSEHIVPFSVSDEGQYFQLSHPLSEKERMEYKWLYDLKEKQAEKESPEGDDTELDPDPEHA